MRSLPIACRAALLTPFLLLLACSDRQPLTPEATPAFNHVRGPMPSTIVDVNNLTMQVNPNFIWGGFRAGTQFLYAGGLAYGTGPAAVVWYDTRDGSTGLMALTEPRVQRPGAVADHRTISLLADVGSQVNGPNTPPRLFVVQETFAFAAAADANYLIVKYTLHNPGPGAVNGLYAGQVLDLDVGPDIGQNFITYDAGAGLVQQWEGPTNNAAGHILLGEPVASFRQWWNGNSGPPDHVDPTSWGAMFGYLSGGVTLAPYPGPGDLRALLGVGPVDLAAGASRAVAFAVLADTDVTAVGADAAAARARWDAVKAAIGGPYPFADAQLAGVPRTLMLTAQGTFQARLTFASSAVARLVDASSARCAGAPATGVKVSRQTVTLSVNWAAIDAQTIVNGRVICAGYLTDGTAWAADASVDVGPWQPELLPATVRRLTFDPASDAHAEWSPDGRSILFDSNRGGANSPTIYRMSADSGEGNLVAVVANALWPDWSPDGATIAFVVAGGGVSTIPAAGGSAVLLAANGGMPAWSPDGSAIAFARNMARELWVMAADGGDARQVDAAPLNNAYMYPHWSPDRLLYFQTHGRSDDTTVAVFRADPAIGAGSVARVTPIEGVPNYSPAVSPNGRILAFCSVVPDVGRELVLQNLRTGEHVVVQFDAAGVRVQDRVEWSPDGKRIAFSSGGDIYVADVSEAYRRWRL